MHCQKKYFIILLILSIINFVKVEDDNSLANKKIPDKNPSISTSTTSNELLNKSNPNDNQINSKNNKSTTTKHQDSNELQDTQSNKPEIINLTNNNPLVSTIEPFMYSTSSSLNTVLIENNGDKLIDENKKSNNKEESREDCVVVEELTNKKLSIDYTKIAEQNSKKSCVKKEQLDLTKKKLDELKDKLDKVDNKDSKFVYTLKPYNDYDNILKIYLERSSSNSSFELRFFWSKLNSTIKAAVSSSEKDKIKSYYILLTLYENFVLIEKVLIKDELELNRPKVIEFNNFENLTYSIGISKMIGSNKTENDLNFYLIKDVHQLMQNGNKLEQLKTQPLSSNSQILIYTIASFLLLAIIIILLYYRRGKFKSFINHFDSGPKHQNSKYVRKSNNQVTNVSNLENNHYSFNEASNPFEQQFLKNTARLNYSDRIGSFSFRNNNRDKLSLSKSGIGRVLEQSVATIKKRTTLKSISPLNADEIDLQSRYSQPILLIDFLPLLNELTKAGSQKLFNEFMQLDIRTNTLKKNSNKVARISKNLHKNKDGCILPFDHSRVVLEVNRFITSDYINGSYIPGINSVKEYIACQCPIKTTTYAFWLMCIQQNVKYIVMATQLTNSFSTIDKYWPDFFVEDGEDIKQIENITIKLRDKKAFKHFTVRIFEVKMNDECKIIKHYQLTDWNDLENYESVIMLTEFIKLFREEIGYGENLIGNPISPIVVHCSNGVSKTAIFIAVDRIYVQLKKGKNDYIDIFGTVLEMRQYRPSMIQNEAQFKFIYESIGELVRKIFPNLVKQLEFDKTLDEINLKDFDANNNLDNSFNSQISLVKMFNNSINKSLEPKSNGYINQTFVHEKSLQV